MRISILLAAVVVFGASTAHAQTPTATSVVQSVDAFYQGVQQCTASFSQTVTNATFGKTTTSKGTLRLEPGKIKKSLFKVNPKAKLLKGYRLIP